MLVIAFIGVLLVATVCMNALITRRSGRQDAIERHERALDALRDLSEHPRPLPEFAHPDEPPTDHIRIIGQRPESVPPYRTHSKRAAASHPSGVRARIEVPASRAVEDIRPAALKFDDASQAPAPPRPEPAFARELPPLGRSWSWPSGRAALVAAASAVTVALVALLVTTALSPAHHPRAVTAPPVRPAADTPVTAAPTTTTPTTIALAPAQLLVSPTGNGTVSVRAPYALALTTNGPCWVSITDASGHTVFQGTLQPGQRQDVPGAGPVVVRLGNTPAAQLTVNGTPLDLSKMSEVATLHFVASA